MVRVVIMLAIPLTILLVFLTVTIVMAWVSEAGLCGTWMVSVTARILLYVMQLICRIRVTLL